IPTTASAVHFGSSIRRNVMSFPAPRLLSLSAVILITTSVALAQHDSGGVTGGGMMGGNTSRPSTKPTTKPTSTTTTAPRKKPTTTPVKRPTTTATQTSADSYYQQGEALYRQKKYREALDLYLKATDINP